MSGLANGQIEAADVLIADDNPNNLQVLAKMLEEMGCDVRVAMNGDEALASVAAAPPDLIILDIHMPKMDGYETCERLKGNEQTCAIPVIFASALSETFNIVKGFELGAVDYITKPLKLEELKACVLAHLTVARQKRLLKENYEEFRLFNQAMVKRENRIIELKEEVNQLAEELRREPPYPAIWKD